MKTIFMMSGAVAVAAVAAMVWGAQPARSSQDWLAKAQSEFATKARDAVIQRQIGKTSNGFDSAPVVTASASPDLSAPIADPAPVLATTATQAPIAPLAVEPVTDMSFASAPVDVVTAPARPEVMAFAAPSREDIAAPSLLQPEAHDVAVSKPAEIITLQPATAIASPAAPVASSSTAPAELIKRAAQPSVAETQPRSATPQKARHATKSVASAHPSHRPESNAAMQARGFEALRQRAPEIAAMVARYM